MRVTKPIIVDAWSVDLKIHVKGDKIRRFWRFKRTFTCKQVDMNMKVVFTWIMDMHDIERDKKPESVDDFTLDIFQADRKYKSSSHKNGQPHSSKMPSSEKRDTL